MNNFPFIGPSYKGRSDNYSAQRTVNLYLEAGKGKAPGLLIGTPGLTAPWVTLSGGGVRGMFSTESFALMVCGSNVYKVTTAASATMLGTVANDNRPAQIVSNGTTFMIAAGGALYSTDGTTVTYIRNDVSSVDFIAGFFVITIENAGTFFVSDSYSTNFDPLSFATAEGSPDNLVKCLVSRRIVYLFGTKTVEQWYVGGGSFPLGSVDGGLYEIGLAAKDSLVKLDTPIWLGGDENGAGAVWILSGGAPQRISTPAVEYAIAQWPDLSDAEAFVYTQEGHSFYVLSSNQGHQTWVYDLSSGEWHERAYLTAGGDFTRIRPRCHLYFAGKHLVGDWENGNVYEYDLDTYSDNGNPLVALRACQTLQSGLEVQPNVTLQLDLDAGVGITTGQGSNPQAMLRWSKDGGKTWSNSLWRTMGRIGEYKRRVLWNRVGGGDRTVFEVSISDPVKRNITGAYLR